MPCVVFPSLSSLSLLSWVWVILIFVVWIHSLIFLAFILVFHLAIGPLRLFWLYSIGILNCFSIILSVEFVSLGFLGALCRFSGSLLTEPSELSSFHIDICRFNSLTNCFSISFDSSCLWFVEWSPLFSFSSPFVTLSIDYIARSISSKALCLLGRVHPCFECILCLYYIDLFVLDHYIRSAQN